MWTSGNYYWDSARIAAVPLLEQVNMLQKHANRNGMCVDRFTTDRDDICVYAHVGQGYFTIAMLGKWEDEE